MTSTATILAIMLGLAVGIDYALFIVSRHRQQLAEGLDKMNLLDVPSLQQAVQLSLLV